MDRWGLRDYRHFKLPRLPRLTLQNYAGVVKRGAMLAVRCHFGNQGNHYAWHPGLRRHWATQGDRAVVIFSLVRPSLCVAPWVAPSLGNPGGPKLSSLSAWSCHHSHVHSIVLAPWVAPSLGNLGARAVVIFSLGMPSHQCW